MKVAVEGGRPFRISSDVGERVPIPWTASGRLLVSHLSDAEIKELIPEEDFQLPNGEWLPPAEFIAEVRQASAAGYFTFLARLEGPDGEPHYAPATRKNILEGLTAGQIVVGP